MLLSFFALTPFSGALTPFGHSLAPSARALQGLPFKIRCLVQSHHISYLLSPKHPPWRWKAGTSQVFQWDIHTHQVSDEIQASTGLSHLLNKASAFWSLFCAEFSPAMLMDINLGTCLRFSLAAASSCCSCSALPSNTESWDVWPSTHEVMEINTWQLCLRGKAGKPLRQNLGWRGFGTSKE